MKLKTWLAGMVGAVALALFGVSAQAAPAGGVKDLKSATAQPADVQEATYGYHRHYYRRYHYYPRYRYRYHYHRPGFRFYYGPRYHRRHYHRYY